MEALSLNQVEEHLPKSLSEYPTLLQGLSQLSLEQRISTERLLCRTDLYFLLRYALNRADIEKEWLFERCREIQREPNGHIDIWSREHYKSSIITFGKTIQDVLASHGDDPLPLWNGLEVTVGIFSFSRPSAKKFLRQIKFEFEGNQILKSLFPDILYEYPQRESPKWSEDDGLIVKRKSNPREATIEASGLVDGMPTGMHYLIRVYDDVVTLDNARSAEMIRKTNQAWALSLALGRDGGYERYVGTFYADGDTYNHMIEHEAGIPRIYPATEDGTFSGKPVLFSQEYLDAKKKGGAYDFSCQYLCNPVPDDSAYFKRDDFQFYDSLPSQLRMYGAGDFALTDGGGDSTEMAIGGVDPNDDLYLVDWWTGQETMDVWIEAMLDLVEKHKPHLWGAEAGQIRRATEPWLDKAMRKRKTWVQMEWFPAISDKPTMARSFQAMAKTGRVYLPRTMWAEDLIDQLIRFPKGRKDDKVDVCGLFGRLIDQMHTPFVAEPEKEKEPVDSYGFEEEIDSEWKTL